jgi:hypothetical protein
MMGYKLEGAIIISRILSVYRHYFKDSSYLLRLKQIEMMNLLLEFGLDDLAALILKENDCSHLQYAYAIETQQLHLVESEALNKQTIRENSKEGPLAEIDRAILNAKLLKNKVSCILNSRD